MVQISRRHALLGTMAGSLAGCASALDRASFTGLTPTVTATFKHGVASGDPDPTSVVLWTRVTSADPVVPIMVEVAADKDFTKIVRSLTSVTSPAKDYTVKVVADQLEPGKTYYYRFMVGADPSPVGRTKTLPLNAEKAKFAVVSCSNFPFGFFNAYDHIARRNDIDAVIHLGDYLYEYGRDGYGAKVGVKIGREHNPPHEIVSLEDYRMRHAQYKTDAGAQAMHAAHPFIATWDDHETANNSWERSAENHQPETEGEWAARRRAALQAYYEWMPVRDPEPGRAREALYKSYSWGGLCTLATIETRLTARQEQLDYANIVPGLKTPEDIERFRRDVLADPSRTMLGDAQLAYLEGALRKSVDKGEPWRLIGNQIMMATVISPNLEPYTDEETIAELEKEWDGVRAFIQFSTLGLPLNLDAWDGYPIARERFYDVAKKVGAKDMIVLTGDSHEAWGNDLYAADDTRMGVELGATGVSSPAPSSYLKDKAFDYSLLMRRENRDIRFHDPMHNGYIALTLDGDEGQVDYVSVSTVLTRRYEARVEARFALKKKNGTVEFSNPKALGLKERVVF